jgi:hypothetical protein
MNKSQIYLCKSKCVCALSRLHKSKFATLSALLVAGFSGQLHASFWNSSAVPPTTQATNDSASVSLGLKFYSDVAGSVTAVRFYKGTNNLGTHVGAIWSASGAKLASVTFSNETASGWQQASFSSPVTIAANTTYVISYLAPRGNYAVQQNYSWTSLTATPLHIATATPGVFAYGSSALLPNASYKNSNYFVDLVFTPAGSTSTQKFTISGKVSGAATLTLSGPSSASTKTDSSGNYSFAGLTNGTYVVAPSQTGYAFSPSTAAAVVSNANVSGINFTAVSSTSHSVTLRWSPSASIGVLGYNVYRSSLSGGPYGLISLSLLSGTSYTDNNVSAGNTYYYVTTAIGIANMESGYSNQTVAVVPAP